MPDAGNVPLRKLGKNGPEIPALGFGLMGLSIAYGTPPSDEERLKVLDHAYELGARNWDSSDLYGDNETLLRTWFARTGKRSEIFLASKFGFQKENNPGWTIVNTSGKYCKEACAATLKELGVDFIDLYYAHRVHYDTPIEETMRALVELKQEGKIKYIGLSEVSSSTLRRAHKVHPVDAVQIEYSAFVLDIERSKGTDLLAACRELGVAVVAYSPLGRGLLTGAFSTKDAITGAGDARSANFPMFSEENLKANAKLVEQFMALADKKQCTPGQLALAWLLKQGDDIIPIPGTKRIKYLEENWGALDVNLSDEDEKEIRDFVETADIAGGRYVGDSLNLTFGDTREES